MSTPPIFDERFTGELAELFAWRRDVRHFHTRAVETAMMDDLLASACRAPSVGLSQPWRLARVRQEERREAVRAIYRRCNADAQSLQPAERAGLYARLKLSGLEEAPEQIAVFIDPDPATGGGLGRATMPETLAYSAVLAIHTLWLGASARGLGLGWVSILDPVAMAGALDVPAHWRFVAYLCIGYPREPSDVPELERAGWERRAPLADVLLER
ncbi:5,6-dimethylbenzimidazole synthase [Ancylobacter sp. A5.8]|uniref:5,6-dimethylbenzimidazole synthase n=1 Tax=Ancylobacter gelatini TaxID=2919920 RepID=UPI001F4E0614|nr:5,6-dimethylbenzimidazole synthase [Ancylobacter gelatini]MCJ8142086.1 5,6-dimethylbenzimidazole synthase [Ancylobacter gelatini]